MLVDVLLVAALKQELEAAKTVASVLQQKIGVAPVWTERDEDRPNPYLLTDYAFPSGRVVSLALARPTRMGANATSPVATSLMERLRPKAVVMCGVCAGNPSDTALGDVIIADLTYEYDEGKRGKNGFSPDHKQWPINNAWLRKAQELAVGPLSSYGDATADDADSWLLDLLERDVDPVGHPARSRYFRRGSWKPAVESLEARGLMRHVSGRLRITKDGIARVKRSRLLDLDPPERLPMQIHVGPIASGNAVVKDGLTWDLLRAQGVRKVLGLEMEAAAVGASAHTQQLSNWVVVKGVMDHADPSKDDRYKSFAAIASAEVLFHFLDAVQQDLGGRSSSVVQSSRAPAEKSTAVTDAPETKPSSYAKRVLNAARKVADLDSSFAAMDTQFLRVTGSSMIFQKGRTTEFSSERIFASLVSIGIPVSVAVDVPGAIISALETGVKMPQSEPFLSSRDIKASALRALQAFRFHESYGPEEVDSWCATYVRRYGSTSSYVKVIYNDNEVDLDFDFIKTILLPHVVAEILGAEKGTDVVKIYSRIFTLKTLKRMAGEVLKSINSINMYSIRYKTLYNLTRDIMLNPPHPWIVNPDTMLEVFNYNVERARFHVEEVVKARIRGDVPNVMASTREGILHLCASMLSKYGCLLGVDSHYGLHELSRIIGLRVSDRNFVLWQYCKLDEMEKDVEDVGYSLGALQLFLERIVNTIGNAGADDAIESAATQCLRLAHVLSEILGVNFGLSPSASSSQS